MSENAAAQVLRMALDRNRSEIARVQAEAVEQERRAGEREKWLEKLRRDQADIEAGLRDLGFKSE